jgi:hypothetical protein
LLLSVFGFRGGLAVMAAGVCVVLIAVLAALPASIGQAKRKTPLERHPFEFIRHQPPVAGAHGLVCGA